MAAAALDAMVAQLGVAANPSSLHAAGRRARRVVEESRERIAAALGVRPSEVVFTSGGTESDNLAVKGLAWARRREDPRRRRVLVSAVEHHAVLDSAAWLAEQQGFSCELVGVDATGRVTPELLLAALVADGSDGSDVALVSVQWANNEVGTVQPVAELAALCAARGIPFHSDAVQAVGVLPVDGRAVDALSLTGHKLGGPVGVGALVCGRGRELVPTSHGGGQERDVRSGTVDTAGVAGFGVAVEQAVAEREQRAAHVRGLRDRLLGGLRAIAPDLLVNGADPALPAARLPGNLHVTFPGCEGDSLLLLLDAAGIECSTGSACSAGVARPSHVVLAMGVAPELARGSLRFTLGATSTQDDVDAVCAALPGVLERARRAGAALAV
ncbi:MAG: putative aminotransferase [Mycobacterium sp.]|jgi:cysteine desulfurase|nr:putative aminotransferase [Mycobacterium sp.]